MFELAWIQIMSNGSLKSKRKVFATQAAMERFISKLVESGNCYEILGYRA